METITPQSSGNHISSLNETAQDRQLSIVDLLTALAFALGHDVTAERFQLNAADLDDVPLERLKSACQRARRECRFYPSVAEIRTLAGADAKSQNELEAEQAWQRVNRDLAQRGRNAPPGLDDRTEYAILAAGGRLSINACFSQPVATEQFTKKAFVEAFAKYEAAANLGLHRLPAPIRQLLTAGAEDRPERRLPLASNPYMVVTRKPLVKPMPRRLSYAERGTPPDAS